MNTKNGERILKGIVREKNQMAYKYKSIKKPQQFPSQKL
jgi:hypothetical protein